MSWPIEVTNEFDKWYGALSAKDSQAVNGVVDALEEHGPVLQRPVVGAIKDAKASNLKELCVGSLRIIFAFDPRRVAILLLGGDKEGEWKGWYSHAIPAAKALYEEHLETLKKGGLLPSN